MKKNAILIIIMAMIMLILILETIDLNSEKVKVTISIFTGIGSAAIGGVIAVYVANLQIKANKKIQSDQMIKLERNICIIVINDLEDMIEKFCYLNNNYSKKEIPVHIIQPIIILESLNNFKSNYFYLLSEDESIKKISSVINRLKFIEDGLDEKLNNERLDDLSKSCNIAKEIISSLI